MKYEQVVDTCRVLKIIVMINDSDDDDYDEEYDYDDDENGDDSVIFLL